MSAPETCTRCGVVRLKRQRWYWLRSDVGKLVAVYCAGCAPIAVPDRVELRRERNRAARDHR